MKIHVLKNDHHIGYHIIIYTVCWSNFRWCSSLVIVTYNVNKSPYFHWEYNYFMAGTEIMIKEKDRETTLSRGDEHT